MQKFAAWSVLSSDSLSFFAVKILTKFRAEKLAEKSLNYAISTVLNFVFLHEIRKPCVQNSERELSLSAALVYKPIDTVMGV